MRTVYLVQKSRGEWDDYITWVDRAYFDREKAEKYIKKYNSKLALLRVVLAEKYNSLLKQEIYEHPDLDRYNKISELNSAFLREAKLYE